MQKSLMAVLILISCLFCVSTAHGYGGFYLGIQAGYSAQKPSLKDIEFNTDTTFLYGLRVGMKFMMVALEASYFQAAHNLELKDIIGFHWGDRQIDYNFIGLNLKYFIPFAMMHPYLTAGYGYYTAEIRNIDKDRSKGFNFGLGLEIHFGDKISLVAEGKYHYVKFDIEEKDLSLGDFTISGGVSFYFQ